MSQHRRRTARLLFPAALMGLAALAGCGGSGTTAPPATPSVSLSATSLTFSAQSAGTASAAQTVTLTNTGNAALGFSGATVGGANASSFAVTTTCGATVAAGASCNVAITFAPAAAGAFTASVSISDSASTSPQTIALAGQGVAPAASLSMTSLTFPAQMAGTTSAAQSVTLTNSGSGPMTLGAISLGGANASSFAATNTCGTTLAAGATCSIAVTFSPAAAGTFAATLSVADNAAGSPQTIALSGTGVTPIASLSATSLSFGSQLVNTASNAQAVTLTNSGTGPMTFTGATLTGTGAASYAATNTCGTTIAAGASCVISVTFTPSTTGVIAAGISISDNAAGSPQTVSLSGTGIAPVASLSATSLTFAAQLTGTTSAAQTVTLTNTGTAPLTFSGATLGGTNASSFATTNTCGATLAAGANCVVSVTFSPSSLGALTASLSVADNAAGSPQTIALSGTGVAPSVTLSPASLSFTAAAGSTSPTQVVLLTNTGTGPLNLSGITVGGANASSFTALNSCGTAVAAGANCTITVSFTPTAATMYAATVSIADNAAGSPQTIALTGTGTPVPAPIISFSSPSLSFTQLAETTSAAQTVTLTNTGNATMTFGGIAVTGTNAWNFPMTNTCGATLGIGATCTVSIKFNPSLATTFSASLAISGNTLPATTTMPLTGTGTGTLSINTATANDWKITNGAITIDWNSQTGNLWGVHLTGYTDNMVDTTTTSNGQPDGLYMDNTGQGTGTVTSGYSQVGNDYIDWWISTASNSTNPFTYTLHYIITANDTGFHIYSTVAHSATDIAGSIGQWQYVFRINLADFTTTYTVNEGLGNLGVQTVPLPAPSVSGNADPGRQVSNAVVDLHGLTLPSGFTREFYTKYDYSSYEYLHQEHGIYGAQFGAWMVLPSTESLVGGPTKQDLIFTDNILMMEALSSHFVSNLAYTPPQGVATNRLFGPYYYHFNAFTATNTTPASLYAEAATYEPVFNYLYDNEATLASAGGYVASTGRGTVAPTITNGGSSTPNTAWTVLSDNATNFQYTTQGRQYWVNQNATGTASLTGVVPGTYRMSSYVLGQWGEARMDNVVVTANQTTTPAMTFTPENFSTSPPIWTIGTPDRSAHEFLHGHDASGNDLRNYWGSYNFWQDFAANNGNQVFYATAEGSTPATTDLNQINYVQWGTFDPGLFGGVYNSTDDTTDGYNYVIPAYVASLSGATGTNGVGTTAPPLNIHFTTTAAQQAQGQYTVLSMALACSESDVFATLNGTQLIWRPDNASDCMVRSGQSGFTQFIAFQWPTSLLKAAGQDNVLSLSSNHAEGYTNDAMRLEITNTSAAPSVRGWYDYDFVYGNTQTPANDAVPNP